ncbi:MAG: hypothetical protein IJ134_02290 [Bacilli bacterium]|nr:hypothetical protein [Bacilli bacterium]
MLDDFIFEQKIPYKILKNALQKNKISHAYLIETNNYTLSFPFALAFAKALQCPKKLTNKNNCGKCTQCDRINNGNFSEIKIIEPDGLFIKKEQLSDLQKEFSTKSIESNYKIYIIKNAEKLNISAANSILKFLEEPEENIIAILLTNNIHEMLNTIISRCQIVKLKSSSDENILSVLFENNDNRDVLIEKTIEFVIFYEKEKINTLLYTQTLWHDIFNDKKIIADAFDIMILFYKDILNYFFVSKINTFLEYEESIKKIVENNQIVDIVKKINKLLEMKKKIYYNINNQLLIDKLIIEWEK